jgi:predicted DNA-binding ribbon-helix-helix protein
MAKRLQSPDMRHVRVGKDNTTITLQEEFSEQLRIIAVARNVAISQLLAEIDRAMRLQPARPGYRRVRTLSAAVRVFVLQTLTSPPSNAGRRAFARSPWSLPRGMHPSKAVRIVSAP